MYGRVYSVMKWALQQCEHYKEIQKTYLISLPRWHHSFPVMHCNIWKNVIPLKLSTFKTQHAIEMWFSPARSENFSAFFQTFRFSHQKIHLNATRKIYVFGQLNNTVDCWVRGSVHLRLLSGAMYMVQLLSLVFGLVHNKRV